MVLCNKLKGLKAAITGLYFGNFYTTQQAVNNHQPQDIAVMHVAQMHFFFSVVKCFIMSKTRCCVINSYFKIYLIVRTL